jgi:hypothetical protein
MVQDGWEEIADLALTWATEQAALHVSGRASSAGEQTPANATSVADG